MKENDVKGTQENTVRAKMFLFIVFPLCSKISIQKKYILYSLAGQFYH